MKPTEVEDNVRISYSNYVLVRKTVRTENVGGVKIKKIKGG